MEKLDLINVVHCIFFFFGQWSPREENLSLQGS
jgi:hypothetical protein